MALCFAPLSAFLGRERSPRSKPLAVVLVPGQPSPGPPVCRQPGCDRPAYKGKKGAFCSRSCMDASPRCTAPGCHQPAYDCRPYSFCSFACRRSASGVCEEIDSTSDKYKDIMAQFEKKWMLFAAPRPKKIFRINASEDMQRRFTAKCKQIGYIHCHGHGQNPGNKQRRFHGSTLLCDFSGTPCQDARCCVCRIIENGFDISFLSTGSGNNGAFGAGHYSSSRSSQAYAYSKGKKALFLVNVAVGKSDIVSYPTSSPVLLGYNSRVVDSIIFCGGDELVVPANDQMLPKYLLVF